MRTTAGAREHVSQQVRVLPKAGLLSTLPK